MANDAAEDTRVSMSSYLIKKGLQAAVASGALPAWSYACKLLLSQAKSCSEMLPLQPRGSSEDLMECKQEKGFLWKVHVSCSFLRRKW